MDSLDIKVSEYNKPSSKISYQYFRTNQPKVISIKGSDFLQQSNFHNSNSKNNNELSTYNFILDYESKWNINIMKDEEILHVMNLKLFLEQLNTTKTSHNTYVAQEKLIVEEEFEDIKVKIIFQNISVQLLKNGKKIPLEINNSEAFVLLKEK